MVDIEYNNWRRKFGLLEKASGKPAASDSKDKMYSREISRDTAYNKETKKTTPFCIDGNIETLQYLHSFLKTLSNMDMDAVPDTFNED